jgi:hypothetical protein
MPAWRRIRCKTAGGASVRSTSSPLC